jgi:hypothetical protein
MSEAGDDTSSFQRRQITFSSEIVSTLIASKSERDAVNAPEAHT